jgi:predicted DNA-binding ArsR family transcriptional regulator
MNSILLPLLFKIFFFDIQTNETLPGVKIETNYGVYYSNLNGEISISSNEEIKNVSYVSYLTKNNLKINSDTIIRLKQLE